MSRPTLGAGMPDPYPADAELAELAAALTVLEAHSYHRTLTAAQAARAAMVRRGYACQLLPVWALLAVGPAPGAPAPAARLPVEMVDPPDLPAQPAGPPDPPARPALRVVGSGRAGGT